MYKIATFLLCLSSLLFCDNLSYEHLEALYNSLDSTCIAKQLSFYQAYPNTRQGKKAFAQAWLLLNKYNNEPLSLDYSLKLPEIDLASIIQLINRTPHSPSISLSDEQLLLLEKLGSSLYNRKLKGYLVWTVHELYTLPSEDIDLARAIFLYQFNEDKQKVREYETLLDVMTLQILARLPKNASDIDKIHEINYFIFHEMGFRFPPHSIWAKDIDIYTFLPSVLDSRQGVCLGVSILYLSLAQRLNLPLEIITPPGHIYLSYHAGDLVRNIETTARGIHLPTDQYLGINQRFLIKRSLKEVIGLHFINQASVYLHKKDYQQTASLYLEAKKYLENDYLTNLLLSYAYILNGQEQEAHPLLIWLHTQQDTSSFFQDTLVEELLNNKADVTCLKAILDEVDETKESILKKQQELIEITYQHPACYDGLFHLAITYLQLSRLKEAEHFLEKCALLHDDNPTVTYYLLLIALNRSDYPKAHKLYTTLSSLIHEHQREKMLLYPIELEISLHYVPRNIIKK
ncbi:MAG: hypothetical protein HY860_02155 [Chlamydiales bacterium]|nr:hypothetical protein [Chlamydiales bacterium]